MVIILYCFPKNYFFQVQYVQNYVKIFMKISVCDDCKYFPPLKKKNNNNNMQYFTNLI